ncbi:fructosamine kinase family protein [Terrabacter sp. MAHUQ-38]|nr:fructosamine kinase family protein [Terrabacter sp. MAHUQ-38]MBC9821519.1 fructosamine kinase family protein [Terrabacter sp. MAHUQ-38]
MGPVSSASTTYHRKSWPSAPPGFYEVEAAGLRWLAEAQPLGGARVVEVRDIGPDHIDVARLHAARPTPEAAEALGRGLAVTHGMGAPAFGSPPPDWTGDSWIGRQPQPNHPTATWGLFYAEQRVRPFVRRAVDRGHLDAAGARVVDRVCDRLASGDFDDDLPPARIHGDLWSGNVVFTRDGAVLIDPAAHGGHGLTDLAMLALFGCPGLDLIGAAYAEAAGLTPGWRALIELHQLHPLATHASSHGQPYAVQLVDAARAFV